MIDILIRLVILLGMIGTSIAEHVLYAGGDCGSLKQYPGLRKFIQMGTLLWYPSVEWESEPTQVPYLALDEKEKVYIQSSHTHQDIEEIISSAGIAKLTPEEYSEQRSRRLQESNSRSEPIRNK